MRPTKENSLKLKAIDFRQKYLPQVIKELSFIIEPNDLIIQEVIGKELPLTFSSHLDGEEPLN